MVGFMSQPYSAPRTCIGQCARNIRNDWAFEKTFQFVAVSNQIPIPGACMHQLSFSKALHVDCRIVQGENLLEDDRKRYQLIHFISVKTKTYK
jgi:hypothetical protein